MPEFKTRAEYEQWKQSQLHNMQRSESEPVAATPSSNKETAAFRSGAGSIADIINKYSIGKRIVAVLVLLLLVSIALINCLMNITKSVQDSSTRTPTRFEVECNKAWRGMHVQPGNEGLMLDFILNREHAPGTVGELLQRCIRDRWRPPEH